MENKRKIVWAVCGSFCTVAQNTAVMEKAASEFEIIPVISERTASTDTRFGKAADLIAEISGICGRKPGRSASENKNIGMYFNCFNHI